MNIYLYKKTHNITGLNYLGKTVQDPYKYSGSGKYWKNHIKKHGNDVTTVILKECQDPDELKTWGIYYSELWNVVESDDWANIKPENGDGGDTSLTPNYLKKKHLFGRKGEANPNYGKKMPWSEEQKLAVTGENHHAYGSKWSDDERSERESKGYYWSGKKRPFANREYEFDGDKNPNAKRVMTPNGEFGSLKTAAAGNGLSLKQLYHRLEKRPTEFYRVG